MCVSTPRVTRLDSWTTSSPLHMKLVLAFILLSGSGETVVLSLTSALTSTNVGIGRFTGGNQWIARRDSLLLTLKTNPLAPFVIRSIDVGSEPLYDCTSSFQTFHHDCCLTDSTIRGSFFHYSAHSNFQFF